jgi:hypothetical protein
MSVKRRKISCLAGAALVLLGAALGARAQQGKAVKQNTREREAPPAAAAAPSAAAATPTEDAEAVRYTYEFEQPDFHVHYIKVEHDAAGRGRISFERKNDAETFVEPLELSPTALQRIRSLWDALRFLETDVSYQSEKQFPNLGTMRLGMARGTRQRTAEFNWTNDRDAFALANEYRRVADQAMFVFEITVSRENQPLEAPKLLTRLDSLLARGGLSDPHQLVPLLRDLHGDERLPLIARNHAGRLLKKIEK